MDPKWPECNLEFAKPHQLQQCLQNSKNGLYALDFPSQSDQQTQLSEVMDSSSFSTTQTLLQNSAVQLQKSTFLGKSILKNEVKVELQAKSLTKQVTFNDDVKIWLVERQDEQFQQQENEKHLDFYKGTDNDNIEDDIEEFDFCCEKEEKAIESLCKNERKDSIEDKKESEEFLRSIRNLRRKEEIGLGKKYSSRYIDTNLGNQKNYCKCITF